MFVVGNPFARSDQPDAGMRRADPRKAFEQKEFWDVFQSCLGRIHDRLQSVFVLRELEGLPAEEICKELGITSTNLWVMLYRARVRLKTCLEENWFKANR